MRVERHLQRIEHAELYPEVGSGWGLSIATSDITLNKTATCGGTSGFSQVKLSNTFTTAVPQIVLLAAGGTALSATACYPNNS